MARKLSLPMHGPAMDLLSPPTVDVMRTRLGGRLPPGAGERAQQPAGAIVRLGTGEPVRLGVLLADAGDVVDVMVERGTVRRTSGREASPWVGEVPADLRAVSAEAHAFGALHEGEMVTVTAPGRPPELGTLIEKCRWGGLVQRPDGVVVGVGFRRIARGSTSEGTTRGEAPSR